MAQDLVVCVDYRLQSALGPSWLEVHRVAARQKGAHSWSWARFASESACLPLFSCVVSVFLHVVIMIYHDF